MPIISIMLISTLAGCRVRRLPLPVPPPIVPRVSPYAKAPVRAAHHRYRYFPAHQVYFDTSRNIYFYFSNHAWFSAPVLPPHIHIDRDNYVVMELEGPKPHLYHKQTVKRYPPGVLRNKRQIHNKKPHQGRNDDREEYRENDKKHGKTYQDEKQRRHDEKIDPRKEYRDGYERDEYSKNEKKRGKTYQDQKQRRRDEKIDPRKEYRDEHERDEYSKNNKKRGKTYRDQKQRRRDEKIDPRRDYRDEDDEHRDEENNRRRRYRDEDDEERDDNDAQRKNDAEDWRGSDQVWR